MYVIYFDTLIEIPQVTKWVYEVLEKVGREPHFKPIVVVPKEDFLTMVLERGYGMPSVSFMWCTARFKERPARRLMSMLGIDRYVVLTGVRSAESGRRARLVQRRCGGGCSTFIQRINGGELHLAPLVDWTDDDVFTLLRTEPPPWGGSYDYLLNVIYRERVRTGCWACTVVKRDRALESFGYSDVEELKQEMRKISLDKSYRRENSKLLNEKGVEKMRELLRKIYLRHPELFASYAAFKPDVLERLLGVSTDGFKLPKNITVYVL